MVKQRGFTLIEMAFVIAILGLLVGGGLLAVGPITLRAKINTTNTSLDQIEAALTLFAIRNNRLPCPANGALGATGASYGVEQAPSGSGRTATCPVTAGNAVIPWITLGLDEQYSLDGWDRRISYYPANNTLSATLDSLVDNTAQTSMTCPATSTGGTCAGCLSRTYSSSVQTVTGSTRETSCDPTTHPSLTPSYPYGNYIPVYTSTDGVTFTEVTGSQPLATAVPACPSTGGADSDVSSSNVACAGNRAAYVLISHGQSGWYGWTHSATATATQLAPPTGSTHTLKLANKAGTANAAYGFVQQVNPNLSNQGSSNYFDDIVRWRSPAFIIQQCGAGACGNP